MVEQLQKGLWVGTLQGSVLQTKSYELEQQSSVRFHGQLPCFAHNKTGSVALGSSSSSMLCLLRQAEKHGKFMQDHAS